MIKIFFDLDGTLIDYSKRNYFVYKLLAKKNKLKIIPFGAYWKLKQSKTKITDNQKFLEEFIKTIESPKALKKDKLFTFTKRVLNVLKNKGYKLYLVSYRASKNQTIVQLKKLGIYSFFSKICLGKGESGYKTKVKNIKKYIKKSDTVYVVGDTEDDILAAKEVNAVSVAVLSGIRDKKTLMLYNPNDIIRDIREIEKIINV